MKCKECYACHKSWFPSRRNDYVCTGVREPFVIEDINAECTEYEEKRNKISTEGAVSHFKYGISRDIFKEPVTSYAKMAVAALEKQIAKKPIITADGYWNGMPVYDTWACPNCGECYETDFYEYECCPNCGQKIDWEEQ